VNSWIKTNFGADKAANSGEFTATFNPGPVESLSFQEAAEETAQAIYQKYGAPSLCLSGGLDSEFIVRLFSRLGLGINPVVLVSPLNETESTLALKLCEELGLTPSIATLGFDEFILAHFRKIRQHGLNSLLGSTPLVLADFVGGPILTGYGDAISDDCKRDVLWLPEWDFYTDILGPEHPGPFFAYLPELFIAYCREFDKTVPVQQAKAKLYGIPYRDKLRYDPVIYEVQRKLGFYGKRFITVPYNEVIEKLESNTEFTL
jgi:hypothetical protein